MTKTYAEEIDELFTAAGIEPIPYEQRPGRVVMHKRFKPLTAAQRQQVEEKSTERGYRRFIADRLSVV